MNYESLKVITATSAKNVFLTVHQIAGLDIKGCLLVKSKLILPLDNLISQAGCPFLNINGKRNC